MPATAALDVLDRLEPISDFSRGKANAIFEKADSDPVFVVKHNKPQYVVLSLDAYRRMQEELEDLQDIMLAEERLERFDRSQALTREDIMAEFGITEEGLPNAPEVAIE